MRSYDPQDGYTGRLAAFRGQIDRPPASGRWVSARRMAVHEDAVASVARARKKALTAIERELRLFAISVGRDPDIASRALGRRRRPNLTTAERELAALVV